MKYKITTSQFGEIEFSDDLVYHFQSGPAGFEELHDFIIINDEESAPLRWLLSVEDPSVGFAIVEASLVAPEIYSEVAPEDRENSVLFVIVILRQPPEQVTVNLKAPILVRKDKRIASQVILDSEKYSTRHILT